jgi:hypothetical protein
MRIPFFKIRFYDTADPAGKRLPADAGGVAGYIGGDTPHVWTKSEWRRFGKMPKLPIYVRSNEGNPVSDAGVALMRLYQIGATRGCAVALDLELRVDPPYVLEFGRILQFFGYRVLVYGSLSTVFRNPPLNGYWVAHYTGNAAPEKPLTGKVRGVQYADAQMTGVPWDVSEFKPWQLDHFWK